jgi:membrane-bound serine protease (ClpP class)
VLTWEITPNWTMEISIWAIALIGLAVAALVWFIVTRSIQAHRRQPATGKEELQGKSALVKTALSPKGWVLLDGELWAAISDEGPIAAEEEVQVTRVVDLTVHVTRKITKENPPCGM